MTLEHKSIIGLHSMITQIYSIQTVEEALLCVDAGADYIGVAVATGLNLPAEVSLETCRSIFEAIGSRAGKVLIVVTSTDEPLYPLLKELQPDVLHICGYEYSATPEFVKNAKAARPGVEILQAIAMDGPQALARAEYFAQFCDTLILDSVDPAIGGIGAAGITHDWGLSAEIVRRVKCKVILAGGLGPENVGEAIRAVRPWGVDSFTKTSDKLPDGTSRKNPAKVRAFIANARAAFKEIGA